MEDVTEKDAMCWGNNSEKARGTKTENIGHVAYVCPHPVHLLSVYQGGREEPGHSFPTVQVLWHHCHELTPGTTSVSSLGVEDLVSEGRGVAFSGVEAEYSEQSEDGNR